MNTEECIKILSEHNAHEKTRSAVLVNDSVIDAIDYAVERLKALPPESEGI